MTISYATSLPTNKDVAWPGLSNRTNLRRRTSTTCVSARASLRLVEEHSPGVGQANGDGSSGVAFWNFLSRS